MPGYNQVTEPIQNPCPADAILEECNDLADWTPQDRHDQAEQQWTEKMFQITNHCSLS